MAAQLEAAGTPALGDPTVTQLWAISTMLRVETTDGRAFLKACARVFDAEPAMTEALHRTLPGAVPEVIAIDAAEGWLLMRDAGGVIMGEQPADTWPAALPALAAIHRATSGGLDGIELEDRGPAALAASLPALLESPFVAAFPDDIGPRFRAAAPRLHDACEALASLPPGPTLMHGDFHPWNALRDGDRVVVIDWSDSAMGHPFMDLTNWFKRVGDPTARRAMLDVWLDGLGGRRTSLRPRGGGTPGPRGRGAPPGGELPADRGLARAGRRLGAGGRRAGIRPVGARLARRRARGHGPAPRHLRRVAWPAEEAIAHVPAVRDPGADPSAGGSARVYLDTVWPGRGRVAAGT